MQVIRHVDRRWDWEAFPTNFGFPELDRAQMRYIGSGGSPKSDASTVAPGAFTCTLIHQEPGKRAATHYHAVEELFFVHSGTLTMVWQYGDETIEFRLGPGDAVLNPSDRPHGFRNDTDADVLMQIMVSTAGRMLPTYTEHPSNPDSPVFTPVPAGRYADCVNDAMQYVARASVAPLAADIPGGQILTRPLVMAARYGGQVEPPNFAFATSEMARGCVTPAYTREVEEAVMVVSGVLDIELAGEGEPAVQRCGPRDLAVLPAGVPYRLRNSGAEPVRFATAIGSKDAAPFAWALEPAATLATAWI